MTSTPTSTPSPLASLLPFRIEFGPRALDDLRRRIEDFRWPNLGYDSGWRTGTDDATLRELVRYWARDFDWPRVQADLNRRAHVRGDVEGETMHAMLAAGPAGERRLPLLLIHGWPNTFADFAEVSSILAAPGLDGGPAFDVVAPSLPGFGFSNPPGAPGLHPGRIAERLHLLMRSLGYERYGVQGGDWGAIIGTALALRHPEAVAGLHLNHLPSRPLPADATLSEAERAYLDELASTRFEEGGYVAIQASRPQSLAYAQNDSPVGLLAWMLEKYWAWSDHGDDLWDGGLDRDRVLTDVTLYWLTGTALSAARIYYERAHMTEPYLDGFVEAPTAFLRFPRDPWGGPEDLVRRSYRLVRYSEAQRGGHFAALEQPEALAADVRAFFSTPG